MGAEMGGRHRGMDVCILMTDSLVVVAETNPTL